MDLGAVPRATAARKIAAEAELLSAARPAARVYYPELDGFRFFLFLLIFSSHTSLDGQVYARVPILYDLMQQSWIGVHGFFALSGFIITDSLLREWEATGTLHLRDFYVRRFLKIIPPFYVMIALTVGALCFVP